MVIKTVDRDWIRILIYLKFWIRIHNTDFCLQSNIFILQKNGAGLHTASSCYWDNSTDGSCTVRKSIQHFTRIIKNSKSSKVPKSSNVLFMLLFYDKPIQIVVLDCFSDGRTRRCTALFLYLVWRFEHVVSGEMFGLEMSPWSGLHYLLNLKWSDPLGDSSLTSDMNSFAYGFLCY